MLAIIYFIVTVFGGKLKGGQEIVLIVQSINFVAYYQVIYKKESI